MKVRCLSKGEVSVFQIFSFSNSFRSLFLLQTFSDVYMLKKKKKRGKEKERDKAEEEEEEDQREGERDKM